MNTADPRISRNALFTAPGKWLCILFLASLLPACKNTNNDTSGFLEARARIEHISKAHVSSHGYTGDRISVSYLPKGAKRILYTEASIAAGTYKEGDSLTIYYNPTDPQATVKGNLK